MFRQFTVSIIIADSTTKSPASKYAYSLWYSPSRFFSPPFQCGVLHRMFLLLHPPIFYWLALSEYSTPYMYYRYDFIYSSDNWQLIVGGALEDADTFTITVSESAIAIIFFIFWCWCNPHRRPLLWLMYRTWREIATVTLYISSFI